MLVAVLATLVFVLDGYIIVEDVAVDRGAIAVVAVADIGDAVVILMEFVIFVSVFSATVAIVD